ncbi:MAG: hypothetical protein WAO91_02520 [Candidatus Nitrosotenuis sp.]
MTKTDTKNIGALALLLVIAFAPASIVFAQTTSADTTTDTTTDTTDDTRKDKVKEKRENISDKIRDHVKKRVVRDGVRPSSVDRAADLTFTGQTDGWTILGGTAFKSSIALSGEANHIGGGNWKIKSVGDIVVADRTAKLDLTGNTRGDKITLHGTGTLNSGEAIRLSLKGHFAPTNDPNVFAIAFTNAGIHYVDTGVRVPLMQVGTVTVTQIVPEPVPAPTTAQ